VAAQDESHGRSAERRTPLLLVAAGKAKACVYFALEKVLKAVGEDILAGEGVPQEGDSGAVARNRVMLFGTLQHEIRSLRRRSLDALERCDTPQRVTGELQRLLADLSVAGEADETRSAQPSKKLSSLSASVNRISSWYPQCCVAGLINATVRDIEEYLRAERELQSMPSRGTDLGSVGDRFGYTACYEEISLSDLLGSEGLIAEEDELAGFLRYVRLDARSVRLEGVENGLPISYRQIYLPVDAMPSSDRYMVDRAIGREDAEPQVVLDRRAGANARLVNVVDHGSVRGYGGVETWFSVTQIVRLQRLHTALVGRAAARNAIASVATGEYAALQERLDGAAQIFRGALARQGKSPDLNGFTEVAEDMVMEAFGAGFASIERPRLEDFVAKGLQRVVGEALQRDQARTSPPQIVWSFPPLPEGISETSEIEAMQGAARVRLAMGRLHALMETSSPLVLGDQRVLGRIHGELRGVVCELFRFRGLILWEPECRAVVSRCLDGVVRPLFEKVVEKDQELAGETAAYLLAWIVADGGQRAEEWSFRRCAELLVDLVPAHLDVLGQKDATRAVDAAARVRVLLPAVETVTIDLRARLREYCAS